MFEYTPIWLCICGCDSGNNGNHYTVNPWGRVQENPNSSEAFQYGNLIYYATASYSKKWGIGKVSYASTTTYPMGKRVANKYYWYSTSDLNQYNYKDYKYYWICLEYNQ